MNAPRVEEALKELHASAAEVRAAQTQWTKMAYSARAPRGLRGLRAVLGSPVSEGTAEFGALSCKVARWRLPYWPELEFEAVAGPGGGVWHQWLVRPGEVRRVGFAELVPWTCVVADVAASFPGAEQREGAAPNHWAVDFSHESRKYRALFVYGLFQGFAPAGRNPADA
ncbi:hypothetical protein ACIBG7_21940 [Nonomuraea sp. NPDC050328]|uniref:hypothetical protein n=1 Tax=Nonomuraea sp. NPDC050328 TaxID=3364361 RepID=UPI00379E3995